jgi:twitching motility protein PilT
MARIDSFLRLVADQGASDLHFTAGTCPTIRHDGDLVSLPFRTLSGSESRRFIREMLTQEERDALDEQHELDFVYALKDVGRFRVNVFNQSRGIGAIFRVIPKTVPTIDSLSLPASIRRLLDHQNGLILVCGPTGSGKTSTLAALVNEVNMNVNRSKHVITVEDPIEFIHTPKHSVITQRQVGLHTESFASALRSALREAPDVIVVGEMRDLETISLALSAAETGTLVFGTLHTNSAAKAIDRIIDAFPDANRDQMRGSLSVLLRGVISQHLVKRASGEGRIAALELLLQSVAISNMIRENKIHQIEAFLSSPSNEAAGSQGLDSCLFRLIKSGIVLPEDGLRVANHPEELKKLVSDLPEE